MKTANEIMNETNPCEIGLALIYIEHERQLCNLSKLNDYIDMARQEGIMQGILKASKLLGVKDFYSTTITNLRYAIQEENK